MSDLDDLNLFNNNMFDTDLDDLYNLDRADRRETESLIFPSNLVFSNAGCDPPEPLFPLVASNGKENSGQKENGTSNSQTAFTELNSDKKPKINVLSMEETRNLWSEAEKQKKIEKFQKEFRMNHFRKNQPEGVFYNEKTQKFEKFSEIETIDREINDLMKDQKVDIQNFKAKTVDKDIVSKVKSNPEMSKEIISAAMVKKVDPKEALKDLNKELVKEVLEKDRKRDKSEIRRSSKERRRNKSRSRSRSRSRQTHRKRNRSRSRNRTRDSKGRSRDLSRDKSRSKSRRRSRDRSRGKSMDSPRGKSRDKSRSRDFSALRINQKDSSFAEPKSHLAPFTFSPNCPKNLFTPTRSTYTIDLRSDESVNKRKKIYDQLQDFVVNVKVDNINYFVNKSSESQQEMELEDFSARLMGQLKSISEDSTFTELIKWNEFADKKLKIDFSCLFKEYITFRDKCRIADREVLTLCLFYNMWINQSLVKSADKMKSKLKVLVPEEKYLQDGKGKELRKSESEKKDRNSEEDEEEIQGFPYVDKNVEEKCNKPSISDVLFSSKSECRNLHDKRSRSKSVSPLPSLSPILTKMQNKAQEMTSKIKIEENKGTKEKYPVSKKINDTSDIDSLDSGENKFLNRKRGRKNESPNSSLIDESKSKKKESRDKLNSSSISAKSDTKYKKNKKEDSKCNNKVKSKLDIPDTKESKKKSKLHNNKSLSTPDHSMISYREATEISFGEAQHPEMNDYGSTVVNKLSQKNVEERKKTREKLEERINNDPKHNLIMKLAHKINDPNHWNDLKQFIPLESNQKLLEKALKGKIESPISVDLYKLENYRVYVTIDPKENKFRVLRKFSSNKEKE